MKDQGAYWFRQMVRVCLAACVLAVALPLAAQEAPPEGDGNPLEEARRRIENAVRRIAIPRSRLTNGPHVRAAFRDVVAGPSRATVRVRSQGKDVALGGIVGPDGWILTKASPLQEPISVRLRDGREFDAELVGNDTEFDLAMLKVDARSLPTLDLDDVDLPEVGSWVASAAPARDPVAVGIISVGPRSIPKQSGILGVQLEEAEDGRPLVVQVVPESGAARAGILVNDIILAVNGKSTETRKKLVLAIREFSPDEEIEITIERYGERQTIRATLTDRVQGMRFDRGEYQNNLGGKLSKRRYGFPTVFQHDTVLQPDECGGPLVDLDGRVVGFNIARAGRTESYAIPTSVVLSRLYDLMSGSLSPEAGDAEQQSLTKERAEADGAENAAADGKAVGG